MDLRIPIALLLEDEPLIAMDVEHTLSAAGFDVTTVASCSDALDWLEVCRPDIVIVDIILRDGPCQEVVARLVVDDIPFIVHSGDHSSMHSGTSFASGTWVGKPADGAAMVDAVRGLLPA